MQKSYKSNTGIKQACSLICLIAHNVNINGIAKSPTSHSMHYHVGQAYHTVYIMLQYLLTGPYIHSEGQVHVVTDMS